MNLYHILDHMVTAEERQQVLKHYREKDVNEEEALDMVNQPAHYNNGSIECIDAIRAMLGEEGFIAYCRGNAVKYQWRAGLKFNSKEDMKKSVWYTRMANGDDPRGENAPSLYKLTVNP